MGGTGLLITGGGRGGGLLLRGGGRREIREERRYGKGGDGIFPKVEVSRINTA